MSKLPVAKKRGGGLQQYDPARGLKTIAVAEAAERHFRRARDAAKLARAVAVKLTAQRDFVLWWDGEGLNKPGSPILSDRKGLRAGKDGLPDSLTIHRWRRRLKADETFAATLRLAVERCVMICEAARNVAAAQNAGESDWYTPTEIIELARSVLGEIDLDPASHDDAQAVVRAKAYYTAESDGLTRAWHGRVWLNPPYSQPLVGQFCDKLLVEVAAGHVPAAITLTNNGTETQWGQNLLNAAAAVCFPAGRVAFWAPGRESSPLQGQMLCYYGDAGRLFGEVFKTKGVVLEARDD